MWTIDFGCMVITYIILFQSEYVPSFFCYICIVTKERSLLEEYHECFATSFFTVAKSLNY